MYNNCTQVVLSYIHNVSEMIQQIIDGGKNNMKRMEEIEEPATSGGSIEGVYNRWEGLIEGPAEGVNLGDNRGEVD